VTHPGDTSNFEKYPDDEEDDSFDTTGDPYKGLFEQF